MTRSPLALVPLVLLPALAAAEPPWSTAADAPVVRTEGDGASGAVRPPRIASSSPVRLVVDALLLAWSRGLTRVDGPTCQLRPTCGAFAKQAVRRNGWLLGSLMAADRIIRSHLDEERYPPVRRGGRIRLSDPVDANDFWLRE